MTIIPDDFIEVLEHLPPGTKVRIRYEDSAHHLFLKVKAPSATYVRVDGGEAGRPYSAADLHNALTTSGRHLLCLDMSFGPSS